MAKVVHNHWLCFLYDECDVHHNIMLPEGSGAWVGAPAVADQWVRQVILKCVSSLLNSSGSKFLSFFDFLGIFLIGGGRTSLHHVKYFPQMRQSFPIYSTYLHQIGPSTNNDIIEGFTHIVEKNVTLWVRSKPRLAPKPIIQFLMKLSNPMIDLHFRKLSLHPPKQTYNLSN
ncbi:hypothetical protein CR513_27020, partial [Mucuna pruriens]